MFDREKQSLREGRGEEGRSEGGGDPNPHSKVETFSLNKKFPNGEHY